MLTKYDNELKKNNFLKLHPEYLPYIGDNYDEDRVLQIGESHYIEQEYNDTRDEYDINYFCDNWWSYPCADLLAAYPWQYNTREVIKGFVKGTGKFYSIFANFSTAYAESINNIGASKAERIKYYEKRFAFTDFYMMPSIYKATNIIKAIKKGCKKIGIKNANAILDDIEQKSTDVIDGIIEVIKPKKIIFTSSNAANAYKKCGGKYVNDIRVCYAYHPGAIKWNQDQDAIHGKGKARVISALKN